ncbi:leukotriene-A(4) hydrolase [Trichosporon asahii var. asahii CBS 2479]|uniref:Leukotriene-A(4) hydrolase n=1 Tax=Trichosporon asahii var. asahii (strain ATCC 90039 / CBS 2479 / JCM 2466 / KCTC 7840 / NBRC 103889/ NCYC 2677 / UAMH 7654) TaxID=1186058 RepID=J5TMH7_TRIAS|nr:leukotriene-A(4) hydrolase [Trichosporon asahii var. asahii CBS 2479]EJT51631.1 leukotriene-A(4) hydrolase [Trichosporon asahii var. asahii CBS 2479]
MLAIRKRGRGRESRVAVEVWPRWVSQMTACDRMVSAKIRCEVSTQRAIPAFLPDRPCFRLPQSYRSRQYHSQAPKNTLRTMASSTAPVSQDRDLFTLSNYQDIRTDNIDLDWSIDWDKKTIGGTATLKLEAIKDVDEVVLDTSYLDIKDVTVDGKKALDEHIEAMGQALHVKLPSTLKKGQTKSGKYPYLYSQSQADTPAIKATYSSRVTSVLPVLMSALRQSPPSDEEPQYGKKIEYVYKQVTYKAFPDMEGRNWKTGVWTEPQTMKAAYWEFEEDTAKQVATAEDLTSAYRFGVYDFLILPNSFPYGGMENCCLTFATPTLLAGDRSLVDVIAHEISHESLKGYEDTPRFQKLLPDFKNHEDRLREDVHEQVDQTEQWRKHLFDWFGKQENGEEYLKKLDKVNWDEWIHGTGLDLCIDMQYDDSLSKPPTQLAERWAAAAKKGDLSQFKPEDVKDFDSTQKCVMLDHLYELGPKYQPEVAEKLDEIYGFNQTQNAEIKLRFYKIALKSDWVITKGRMKFCRPIFKLLNEQNPELAKKVFKEHAEFYVSDKFAATKPIEAVLMWNGVASRSPPLRGAAV